MLTLEEYQCRSESNAKARIVSLVQLRNSTKSLIIQCLADREIQKNIKNGQSSICCLPLQLCNYSSAPPHFTGISHFYQSNLKQNRKNILFLFLLSFKQ